MNKKIFMCSFCKRNQTEVRKLIVGPNVYICDFCTNICAEILHEEDSSTAINSSTNISSPLTPEDIYKKLDEVVAGQEEAKKQLSIAAYLHYLRMNEDLKHQGDEQKIKKYNMLLIGPTGSGKTLLMQVLAKILNVACIIVDANSLTEAGYVGEDVEGIITKLFNSTYMESNPNLQESIRKTKYGFIFIDEIDKKYAADGAIANRDISGKGVQQNLLKIIEGTDVQVQPGSKKNPHQEPIVINTSSMFIVAGGAFQGLNTIIKQRVKHKFSMGLLTKDSHNSVVVDEYTDLMMNFTRDDLITFGLIPELVGRFECITYLNKLTEAQLVEILKYKKDNLMEEYERIFQLHNVTLLYDNSVLLAIAQSTIKENTGARGLRSIVHKLFSDVIFKMPTLCNKDSNKKFIVKITANNVVNHIPLELVEDVKEASVIPFNGSSVNS